MRAIEIINFARNMRKEMNGINDPGYYCYKKGILIRKIDLNPEVYPAYTTNVSGKPVISINSRYTLRSQMVLCAHELGHAVLHSDNYYNGYGDSNSITEYEANLFAVAFLFDDEDLDVSIDKMSGSELECLLRYNIHLLPNGGREYRYY